MFRVKKFGGWRQHKRPRDGQSFAKSCYCLSDHFHRSGLEGRVCDELRLRKIAGDIKDYRKEQTQHLELDGLSLGTYRADFVIDHNDGTTEIMEAKGIEFQKFKRDWKILEHMHRNNPNIILTIVKK